MIREVTPPLQGAALELLRAEFREVAATIDELTSAAGRIIECLGSSGTLFLAGNGGSMADALHIAGELKKSFERPRPVPKHIADRLSEYEGGATLAAHLQAGLRVHVLGADPVLATAVDNDLEPRHVSFAQDLIALGSPGDVLVALSTSGRSPGIINAAIVARSLGMGVVLLTGDAPGERLSALAEVIVHAPTSGTAAVQIWHSRLYHVLCRVLEDTFFPDPE